MGQKYLSCHEIFSDKISCPSAKANGAPFSIFMAGEKSYIFHTPDDVSRIYRKSSTLAETRSGQVIFRQNILGFTKADAETVASLRSVEAKIHAAHLLTAGELDKLTARFCEEVDLQLEKLDVEIEAANDPFHHMGGEVKKNAFGLVGDVMIQTTVAALFGHEAFDGYPDLFGDLRKFLSDKFFIRAVVNLPEIFVKEAVEARERIKTRLADVIEKLDEYRDVSGYIQQRVGVLGCLGVGRAGIISNEFDIILGQVFHFIFILTCASGLLLRRLGRTSTPSRWPISHSCTFCWTRISLPPSAASLTMSLSSPSRHLHVQHSFQPASHAYNPFSAK